MDLRWMQRKPVDDDAEGVEHEDQVSDMRKQVNELKAEVARLKASPPPLPKVDLMAPGSPAGDVARWRRAHGLPEDPAVAHIDLPIGARSPNAAALARLEHEHAEQMAALEQRTADLAVDAADLRKAPMGPTTRRLQQLGVTDPDVLAAVREPIAQQPVRDPAAPQRERLAKARREIVNAKRIAAAFRQPVDLDDLSALALQLYREERGWSPSNVEVLGGNT